MPIEDAESLAVLFIDSNTDQRTYWTDQFKRCSPEYEILEAADGQSALDLYRSRPIDCVILELSPARSIGLRDINGVNTPCE
jgi:CheY-like chemotaxis protein